MRRALAGALILLAPVGSGCRSARLAEGSAAAPAWGLSAADLARQYLYRVELHTASEAATLRLALRLWSAERFELRAADALGRAAWRLEVDGAEAVWSDARGASRCRIAARAESALPALRLPLAPAALPPLLLGRVPVAPVPVAVWPATGEARFRDARGRTWWVRLAAGVPAAWRLDLAPDSVISWRRDGARAKLSVASEAFEIEWRETRSEALRAAPAPWSVERDLPFCRDADVP